MPRTGVYRFIDDAAAEGDYEESDFERDEDVADGTRLIRR